MSFNCVASLDIGLSVDGLSTVRCNEDCLIILWQRHSIFASDIPRENNDITFIRVLVMDFPVCSILQIDHEIYCLDESGVLHVLTQCEMEHEDIFGMDDVNVCWRSSPRLTLKNVVSLRGINCGIILIKEDVLKTLYLEVFTVGKTSRKIEKSASSALCDVTHVNLFGSRIASYPSQSLDYMLHRLCFDSISSKNSSDAVFFTAPNGHIYCSLVSIHGDLSKPKVLYSCTQPILKVMCLRESEINLYSCIVIVLKLGSFIIMSLNKNYNTFSYKVMHFPCPVHVLCDVGSHIFFGNGDNLLHCSVNDVIGGKGGTVSAQVVGIRGVNIISRLEGNQMILGTLHNTFYYLCAERLEMKNYMPVSVLDVRRETSSLFECLQSIEEYKQEIASEDRVISAFGVTACPKVISGAFSCNVIFHHAARMPSEKWSTCVDKLKDISSQGENVPPHLYFAEVTIENQSEIEFSSCVWSLHVAVNIKGVISHTIHQLETPLNKCMWACNRVSVCIEEPSAVKLSCGVFGEVRYYNERLIPWLYLSIQNRIIDAGHFIQSRLVDNSRIEHFNDVLVKLALSDITRYAAAPNPALLTNSYIHVYAFKLSRERNISDFRSFVLDLGRLKLINQKELKTNLTESIFSIGSMSVKLTWKNQFVMLTAENSAALHKIKKYLISNYMCSSTDLILMENSVAKILLFRNKTQIEASLMNDISVTGLKTSWRNFVAESFPV